MQCLYEKGFLPSERASDQSKLDEQIECLRGGVKGEGKGGSPQLAGGWLSFAVSAICDFNSTIYPFCLLL